MLCVTKTAYLRHIIQAVEDVLASLLGLDPCFTLVVLWSLRETRSRCSSQIPSHFPSGNALFTFGSLQPLVVDVQQDSACPPSNPGVAHKRSSNSQGRRGERRHVEAHTLYHWDNVQNINCTARTRFTHVHMDAHLRKLYENAQTSINTRDRSLSKDLKNCTTLICVDYRKLLSEHIIFLITVSRVMQLLLRGNTWQGQIKAEQSLFRVEKKSGQGALTFDFPLPKDSRKPWPVKAVVSRASSDSSLQCCCQLLSSGGPQKPPYITTICFNKGPPKPIGNTVFFRENWEILKFDQKHERFAKPLPDSC